MRYNTYVLTDNWKGHEDGATTPFDLPGDVAERRSHPLESLFSIFGRPVAIGVVTHIVDLKTSTERLTVLFGTQKQIIFLKNDVTFRLIKNNKNRRGWTSMNFRLGGDDGRTLGGHTERDNDARIVPSVIMIIRGISSSGPITIIINIIIVVDTSVTTIYTR